MKIYLAAPYAARDILKGHLPMWTEAGHEVTCGWVKGTRPLGDATYGVSEASTDEEVYLHASRDLGDIEEAEIVIHYTAQYLKSIDPSLDDVTHNLHSGGRHVETGFAIAKGKHVIVIGPMENIFQRGLCLVVDDIDGAMVILDWLKP